MKSMESRPLEDPGRDDGMRVERSSGGSSTGVRIRVGVGVDGGGGVGYDVREALASK